MPHMAFEIGSFPKWSGSNYDNYWNWHHPNYNWARSIQPKFPEISVQNSMDRFGPTGKVSKKQVHLLRWTTFHGRTSWDFCWMDRAHYSFSAFQVFDSFIEDSQLTSTWTVTLQVVQLFENWLCYNCKAETLFKTMTDHFWIKGDKKCWNNSTAILFGVKKMNLGFFVIL